MLEVGAMTAASSLARRGRVRGPLNADDVGAPVRELPDTGRAGPRDRQVDDTDVVQRKLRGHVLLRPCPSGGRPTPIIAAVTPGSSRGRVPFMSLLLGHSMPWRRRCGAAEDLQPSWPRRIPWWCWMRRLPFPEPRPESLC